MVAALCTAYFKIKFRCILDTEYIYVFYVILKTNSNNYNEDVCFFCDSNSVFKYYEEEMCSLHC
jgi:hypothetical protein